MSRVIDDESAPGARPKPGFERAGLGGLPGGRLRGWGTYCGGLGYPCGGELEIRSHVGDLDLDGLTLVAVVVLPAALDELAGHEHPHARREAAARVLGHRWPCRAAEESVVDDLPLAVGLAAVADRNGEAYEGRTTLGVAKLGIVRDASDGPSRGSCSWYCRDCRYSVDS